MEEVKLCGMRNDCKNPATEEEHPCPYDVEINGAPYDEGTCNCCEDCEYECAMDI